MKNAVRKVKRTSLLLTSVITMLSCTNEDSSAIQEELDQSFDVAELKASDETELISEEVISIVEDVYATDEITATSKNFYSSNYLPDCVTITTVVTTTGKQRTIDFGEGCELPNGNVLGGIIYLSYLKDMDMTTKTLNLSLENFTFNGAEVEGSASIDRMRSNENGNPQADVAGSFTATWTDGSTASFTGDRTREWIEGYGSGFWADNVFLISGKRSYSGKLGNTLMKETIIPLRRELSCRFIVSGILEITRNDNKATLDFGDGECDANGVLTYPDGSTEEILLRRFKNLRK